MQRPIGPLGKAFEKWAALSYDYARLTLFFSLVVLAGLISQIPKVKFDMSTEAMLHKTDPARVNYDQFKQEFGREDSIILTFPISDPIDQKALDTLDQLHTLIEEQVPHIDKITSLLNARYTYGEDDEMIVEELLEGFPDHHWSNEELNAYVKSQPAYQNRLINKAGTHLAMVLDLQTFQSDVATPTLLSDQQSANAVNAIRKIIADNPEWQLQMTGQPVLLETINYLTNRDTAFSSTVAFAVVLILLYLFFRRRSGILIPVMVITGSIIGSIGVMGITGSPYTLTSTATYALILGMSIADSLHILTLFYRDYEENGDKRAALIYAMGHSAPAVLLTTLTTAIGFLSFMSGDLASTSELGIYAAAAVFFALFYTMSFVPAFLALFNIQRVPNSKAPNLQLDAFLLACAKISTDYPKSITVLSLSAFALCLYGTSFLSFSHNPIGAFPDDTQAKIENLAIDDAFEGLSAIEVIIDTGKGRGIFEKEFIDRLKAAEQALSDTDIDGTPLGDSYSLLDILRESHKALNNNDPAYFLIADDQELIAQETLLFELSNADDLFQVIDSNYSKVRLSLNTRYNDGVVYEKLIRECNQILQDTFGDTATVHITGANALVAASVPRALRTMMKSYVIALVLIVGVMMIVVQSVRIGLISIIPNMLPILLMMNALIVLNIPLDMSTILVGAIAMGIVVDDSLHFLFHFKHNLAHTGDARQAIIQTHTSIGPALFITTVVFAACCLCNVLSSVFSINVFGWSLGIITVLALLADLLIAPALLMILFGKKQTA